jgi:hypothetical protein
MTTLAEQLNKANNIIKETESMRDMQRNYFKYRTSDELKKAKLQERKVDDMIEEYKKPNLFTK